MNRLLLGVLLGLLLGVALGYVAFSGDAPREERPTSFGGSDVAASETRNSTAASLSDVTRDEPAREVAEVQPMEASVSKARLDSVLAKTKTPEVQEERGTLVITGKVLDVDGNGVAGVKVRAMRSLTSSRAKSNDSLRAAAPEFSLATQVKKSADQFAKRRAGLREAISDSTGTFRLEGLVDASYSLSAYKLDYVVRATSRRRIVFPGAEPEFEARRVVGVPIRVLMSSGEPASEAVILCSSDKDHWRSLGPFEWSPARSEVRLPEGALELTAVAEIFERRRSARRATAALSSEVQVVDIPGTGEPPALVFQLEGQTGVRGRVTSRGSIGSGNLVAYLVGLGDSGKVDLEGMRKSDKRVSVHVGGDYSFMDLAPGRYAVGLARTWGGDIEVHRVIEVGTEIVQCDLELPKLDLSRMLSVEVFGSGGQAIKGAKFQFVFSSRNMIRSSRLTPTRITDGRHYLEIPSEARASYFTQEDPENTFSLRVGHDDYGSSIVDLQRGQTEARIDFAPPAKLVVTVIGYEKSSILGRASLEAVPLDSDGSEISSQHYWDSDELNSSGFKDFGNLAPGRYRLKLDVAPTKTERWNSNTVAIQDITVRVGPNETRLAIPDLFALEINIVNGEDAGLSLTRIDADLDPSLHYSDWETANSEGYHKFKDLLPGTYSLKARHGGKSKTVPVTVPTGGVELDTANW